MRWLALTLGLAACGGDRGVLGASCSVDRECEAGLSCQDPNGVSECYPDGTIGCTSARDCPSGDFCEPYGTGTFCRQTTIYDLSVAEPID